VLLLGAVVVIVVLATGDKKKPRPETPWVSTELTGDSVIEKQRDKTAPADRPPPPQPSAEIMAQAKAIVQEMAADSTAADRLYDEAMTAKQANDTATWKAKLLEAKEHYENIMHRWNNEVITAIDDDLPSPAPHGYDAEDVANYYLGAEGQKVSKAITRLAYVKKQLGVQ
jgi:predicted lipid-binding transport protein (Tim44 family)